MIRFAHPRIYTGEGKTPVDTFEVDDDGRIATQSTRPAEVVELPGDAVVPGFIDTHAHLCSLGGGLEDVDVRDVGSPQELLEAVAARAGELPVDGWVTGTGYVDGLDWDGRPTAEELEAAAGGRPVALFRRDRHALLASTTALRLAGVEGTTPDPPGGSIGRQSETGALTGLLVDTAMDWVTAAIPAPTSADLAREAAQKCHYLAGLGVTCVHEAWVSEALWGALCGLCDAGRLPIRVRAMLGEGWRDARRAPPSADPDRLRAIAIKGFADGALGSRGAQLTAPYTDAPTRGIAVQSDEELAQRAELAERFGLQLAVHAIGDAGLRRVLDLFEARATTARAHRWRIEHAQLVHPDDLARLDGIGLAVQPVHFWSDAPWAAERLGRNRLAWSHRFQSLLEAGAQVGFGSDYPIESGDPRDGLRAATAGRHPDAPGWERGTERISRERALAAYWGEAAWLAFDERDLGRLRPGYWADFVCLEGDPYDVADPRDLRVAATYVAGRRVAV